MVTNYTKLKRNPQAGGGRMIADRGSSWVRAINYFTVWELLERRTAEVNRAWNAIRSALDVNKPLPSDVGGLIGLLSLDPSLVRKTQDHVERSMSELARGDLVLVRGGPGYPKLLGEVADAPEILFVRGDAELLHEPALAVVGTRHPSEEGARRAQKLGHLLAQRHLVVASGLARGIDRAAHVGALSVGGDTIAVLGTPLTTCYPKEHAALQRQISEVGALVSQFYPGAGVRSFYFPMRNAVMSGLCLGTIVVEASETSGALIQARQCLGQGRKLFIPQSALDNDRLLWPKRFIKQQNAHQFREIDDLLEALSQEGLIPEATRGLEEVQVCPQPIEPVRLQQCSAR